MHKYVPFIDLRPLNSSLTVVALRILGSLTSSQVNQNQLSNHFLSLSNINLTNSVRSGTGIVCYSCVGCSIGVGLLHYTQ